MSNTRGIKAALVRILTARPGEVVHSSDIVAETGYTHKQVRSGFNNLTYTHKRWGKGIRLHLGRGHHQVDRKDQGMSWRAVFVPVDRSLPPEGFEWEGTRDLSAKIGADLDFLTMRRHNFQVVVDDTGLLDGKPINSRVTQLVNDLGYPNPIAGDAVLIGVTARGYESDCPIEATDARLR